MPGTVASLLLAALRGGDLFHVGSVGTGWKDSVAHVLNQALDKMPAEKPSVRIKGKNIVYARPDFVAEIEYRTWTGDGKLRRASFKGVRDASDEGSAHEIEE